jgi:hypothetical protein
MPAISIICCCPELNFFPPGMDTRGGFFWGTAKKALVSMADAASWTNMKFLLFLHLLVCSLLPVQAEDVAPAATAAPAVVKEDFQKLNVGALPDEIMVVDGAFTIVADGENKVLQIGTEPLTEGAVLLGKSVKNGGIVKAKIKASSKRRSFPRFGVGLGGTSGFRFRVAPADKAVEIVKEDEQLAKADFAWKTDAWYWVELRVLPSATAGSWTIEGRAWEDGQPRPEAPSVTSTSPAAPPNGKASLWGAPFSLMPIQFDDVEVTPGK